MDLGSDRYQKGSIFTDVKLKSVLKPITQHLRNSTLKDSYIEAGFSPKIQQEDTAYMLSKRTGCMHSLGVARGPTRALLLRVPSCVFLYCLAFSNP